jgi:molybdopterin/thiamine biosynthesis adenylyltransferase/rhodanese-related sulfurtransferase/molybdopterin converting factor small subunit
MAITILIPSALQNYTSHRSEVQVQASSVGEALQALADAYPDLRKHLYTEQGKLRSFVNVYLGDEDTRYLQGLDTPLKEGDTLTIVPSIAGGSVSVLEASAAGQVALGNEEILRYSRHLILPDVAMEGQQKLKAAKVLCVGAGGLGAPLALYLAAAGVGTIGLVDFDVVDYTNLQRQVLYTTDDVGRPKLEVAKERLLAMNPHITVRTYETRLTRENALQILADYDVVVDGTDNFATRYLVNDACVLLGKPNVYGSIFRFEGQASVFYAKEGPCYRCLYPEPPPPGLVPSCAEGGVLGVLPGVIGSIQAMETIKLILGKGEPLIGRLLLFHALKMQFRELKLRKNPQCPVCGQNPIVRELIDYDEFCGVRGEEDVVPVDTIEEIAPTELKRRLDAGDDIFLLDVREPVEWQICRLEGAVLIPMNTIPARMHELDSAREMVVYCRSGKRSAQITAFLKAAGFRKVKNLQGGILQWSDEVDPSVPKY